MNFTTSKRLFDLLCGPLLAFLPQTIGHHRADWRSHKFKATHHVLLSLFAQLTRCESTNALVEELNDLSCEGRERNLREMIGFNQLEFGQPITLNQSSLSRANATRSYRLWRYCFHRLFKLAQKYCHPDQLEGLGRVIAVDGSLLDCLGRMGWATYRQTKHKLKGHFFFDLAGLPDRLVLTAGTGSERDVLRTNLQPNTTYVLDRGYNDYTLFATITKARSHFVTRLLKNAVFEVVEDLPVSKDQAVMGVVSDQTIRLTNATAKNEAELVLRMVVYTDCASHQWRYLSSRFDLTAKDIVELYLKRWEIESFFWWIKRHLQMGHWYSECENGVLIQLYAALITFLLLKLYTVLGQASRSEHRALHIDFVRWVQRHLYDPVSSERLAAYWQLLDFKDAVQLC